MTAVLLLSVGLDCATTLAGARRQSHDCWCLSAHYGQQHGAELRAAERIARRLGAREHRVLRLGLGQFGGLALTCVPDAQARACGVCDACRIRKKGFAEAGAADSTREQWWLGGGIC
ncbi:MAG: hypothetical protein FJY47_03210 [Betaproteobacteria bacterium]|nr:hypothetical protein [Betaproteobacteria bacterium]